LVDDTALVALRRGDIFGVVVTQNRVNMVATILLERYAVAYTSWLVVGVSMVAVVVFAEK
jgi:hypothetical protein